ncbi:MAG: RHS repeat protein, partial [Chloroflexi bacterium]|nr:RHS repeat protein [Chloroflexota bacterium]
SAPASWQRQSVVARDGTQVFFYYDTTTGSRGIKVRTSPDGFASATTLTPAVAVVADDQGGGSTWPIGQSGFAVEIDQGADVENRTLFDRIYVAVTGKSGSQTNFLQIYTLSRDATGAYAVDATPITVASNSGGLSGPTWSGATLAIERESQVGTDGQGNPILKDYLWVGADEKGTNGKYTYKTWHRELLADGTLDPAGWTASTPTLVADEATPHYAALVALTGGVAAVGTTSGKFQSTTYPRGGSWESLTQIRLKPPFLNKTYSVIAVTDPLSPDNERFVPLVVLLPVDEQENTKTDKPEYYARRYDPNQSQGLHLAAAWERPHDQFDAIPPGSKESYSPQLTWDGTSFYCFYLAKVTNSERSINGKRGQLGDTAGTLVLEAERTWIKEPSPNKLLKWLGAPRALTSDIVPFFYLADKSTDSFFVQAKRVLMLGDRAQWQYQEIPVPGAGTLKINLANGNLFYTMTDASFSARGWDDELTRSYNAQSTFVSPFGPGWTSVASPRLEFYNSKKDRLEKTFAAGVNRINYYAPDGSQYLYSSQRNNHGGTDWLPELGLTMQLEQILLPVDEKRFKLTDNYGNLVYFNKAGRPVLKQDVDPSGATNHRAWEWPNMGVTGTDLSSIVNKVTTPSDTITGRTQTFTLNSDKRATQITVSGFGDSQTFKYDYDTSKRLSAAKLAYGQSDQLTISYGYYDSGTSKDKLKTITVPASSGNTNPSVYTIFYFPDGKVQAIKLPDPSPTAQDDPTTACGTTGCWLFDYQEGEGLTTVTGPRGATNSGTWSYHVFGSGPAYQITDPDGNDTDQSWSTHFNKISVTRPVGGGQTATTQYEYDENRNRTRIIDPLNGTTDFEYYGDDTDPGRYNRRKAKTEAKTYPDSTRAKTDYAYKDNGMLDRLTDPAQQVVDVDQDSGDMYRVRDRYSQTDDNGVGRKHQLWTHFEYDSGPGLVSEEVRKERTADNVNTWQFLSKTSYTRDAWGRVTQERVGAETADNTNDRMTVTAYDHLGRATSTRVRMGSASQDSQDDLVTQTEYNPDGTIKRVTDPTGGVTDYRYDRRGRVIAIEGPLPTTGSAANDRPCQTFEYDEAGNQIAVRVAVSRTPSTTCIYPKPAGETGTIVWSETDRTFDQRNQKTAEELQTGSDPNYGGKIQTQWSYDPAGRVTGIREPNSTDPDPNAPTVTFEYDKLGRKTKEQRTVTLNGSALPFQRCWEYDAVGNIGKEWLPASSCPNNGASKAYEYDKLQRLTKLTDEQNHQWTYGYDPAGHQTSETNPLSLTSTSEYDSLGRLLVQKQPAPLGYETRYSDDPRGNRATLTDANNRVTTYQYDRDSRVVNVRDPATSAPAWTIALAYDKLGNTISLTDPLNQTQTAVYDRLGRLTSESTPSGTKYSCTGPNTCQSGQLTRTLHYTLDGLVDSETDFANQQTTYAYETSRRLRQVVYPAPSARTVAFTYDPQGNRKTMAENGSTTATWSYDELNRMTADSRGLSFGYDRRFPTSVTYPGSPAKTVSYSYDAAGRLRGVDDWRSSGNHTNLDYDDANRRT